MTLPPVLFAGLAPWDLAPSQLDCLRTMMSQARTAWLPSWEHRVLYPLALCGLVVRNTDGSWSLTP